MTETFDASKWTVPGTHISLRRIVQSLHEKDPSWTYGSDESKITEEPKAKWISEGKGHASKIFSLELAIGGSSHRVAVKVPKVSTLPELSVDKDAMIAAVHNREVDFYTSLSPTFEQRGMKIPKFFGGQHVDDTNEGYILMKDFSDRVTGDFDVARGLSMAQAKSLVEQLCILHANTYVLDDLQSRFPRIPTLLETITDYSRYCVKAIAAKAYAWFDASRAEEVLKWTSVDEYERIISAKMEFGFKTVLAHQDLWPGNILWQRGAEAIDGDALEDLPVAIVDWQCCHAGSFTSDLAALLGVSCDGEFRRKHADELLAFYRDTLFAEFAKIHVDPPTLELATVKRSFDVSLRCAALQMAMTVVTNPKHDEPHEGSNEGPLTKRFRLLLEDLFA